MSATLGKSDAMTDLLHNRSFPDLQTTPTKKRPDTIPVQVLHNDAERANDEYVRMMTKYGERKY